MIRSKLFETNYRPQFSGHETFPLRYGWLKKAFDAVRESSEEDTTGLFSRPEAIAQFGVGRNMVISIRHWATVLGVISEPDDRGVISTTPFGERIFSPRGLDPYLENPSTLWLLHWKLASTTKKTTWYWAFNLFPNRTFDRTTLSQGLVSLAEAQSWSRSSAATIKRDVECFVRTYVPKRVSSKFGFEDAIECPLSELGLIKTLSGRDRFQFVTGPKLSLGLGTFLYALEDFWSDLNSKTVSLETLAHAHGSPGRVFQLDESDLIYRFSDIEKVTNEYYRWSETAGLKQLIRNSRDEADVDKLDFLNLDYQNRKVTVAA